VADPTPLKDSFRPVPDLSRLRARSALVAAVLGGIAAAALTAGILVARGGGGSKPVPEASNGGPAQRVSFVARMIPPKPERGRTAGPGVPRSVADLARRLPLERKVAQVFLVGWRGTNLTADVFRQLRRLDLGGIVMDRSNYTGVQVLTQLAGESVAISQQAKHVPPWVMASQQGAELNAFPDLPPADAPADLASAQAGGQEAAASAGTLRPLGITAVFGPDLDVGQADDPLLGAQMFSDDPRQEAALAETTVPAYTRAGILSAVEHFPGLGAASQPTDQGPAQVGLSLGELRHSDLVPFRAAFRAGAPAVVLSHALYTTDDFTVPGSLSRKIVTGLLRQELHFKGLAITDNLAAPAITVDSSVPDAAIRALRAGADMLYISGPSSDQQAAYVAVLRAVERRQVPRARLDEAVGRILQAKKRFGLIR
jgi:beta-N-acetylhexosaminidase